MVTCFNGSKAANATLITLVTREEFSDWLLAQHDFTKNWLSAINFRAETGKTQLIPDPNGNRHIVLCCIAKDNLWPIGSLPLSLPEGHYHFDAHVFNDYGTMPALVWGLGAYQFTRYKKPSRQPAVLFLPKEHLQALNDEVAAIYLVRDCINTPTEDMGPQQLSQVARHVAEKHHAEFKEIVGEQLLHDNYPAIHAVGRASPNAPRLLDMRWGDKTHPKITLVGKGICFDTGGLDLKPTSAMALMKKDMGGAANVLGLAAMIMAANLPVCLRVLIPAAENVVSGNAYRPGDVIKSRSGMTIEIGNTDAEGRVVLSDALCEAVTEKPELLIDLATLTGAARVALGVELPAAFTNNDDLYTELYKIGEKIADPLWRMPLYAPYKELNNSSIADINNNSAEPYAGAITAALFLAAFVPSEMTWLHIDMMAWNTKAKPGKPVGGEAMVIRALFEYIKAKF